MSSSNKLRVDLEDVHGKTAFAEYSSFSVTSERAKYQLGLGSYSGMLAGACSLFYMGLYKHHRLSLLPFIRLQSFFILNYRVLVQANIAATFKEIQVNYTVFYIP